MTEPLPAAVDRVRAFNRFYTRYAGALEAGLQHGELRRTQVQVLFELAERDDVTAAVLCRYLDLDAGYVSRLLGALESRGLVARRPATHDARASVLALTDAGRAVFAQLDAATAEATAGVLAPLSDAARQRLVEAMGQIQSLLAGPGEGYVLRDPRPGDMGWIVHRHGALYAREYGWNTEFEALVADVVARYIREHDARTERCWIAERDGAAVGSVFVVRHDPQTAKLRLLYVDAGSRGRGIGRRLVEEAIAFAAAVGYKRMVLWTNAALTDAGRLFARTGFELLTEQQEQLFGKPQVSQLWARTL
ncbi:MAG: bifunctional helix-turn-helix transcriptional regulator/GNAT family N-acetyltransferase [Stenotrophomonas maltophilia]